MPRPYFSYSQYKLWNSSPASYRKRYYLNEEIKMNAETFFGKKVAQKLEDGDPDFAHIKKYAVMEHKILTNIEGTDVKLLAYLDTYSPTARCFGEYKTGRKNAKGNHFWNQKTVEKHEQLDWYSMLIQESTGSVKDGCWLAHIETEKKNVTYNGTIFRNTSLQLTGKVFYYYRKIEQWERDLIKEKIIKTIKEIQEDYGLFKKDNQGTLPEARKTSPREEAGGEGVF